MILYYGNRTGQPLMNVSAILAQPGSDDDGGGGGGGGAGGGAGAAAANSAATALRIQVRPDKPFDVKPSEQVLHLFIWECTRPFSDSPALKLQFSYEDAAQQVAQAIPDPDPTR